MSIASIVLGVLALVLLAPMLLLSEPLGNPKSPAALVAVSGVGIPAVVLAMAALARKRPGARIAVVGLIAGLLGTLSAVLLFINTPQDGERMRAKVMNNMHVVQTALECYSVEHGGHYPGRDVWESNDMLTWFPRGDPIGPTAGRSGAYPVNPYTRKEYRYGTDLFCFPDTLGLGASSLADSSNERCPYRGLAAPPGAAPGTIVVLGYTPKTGQIRAPAEYAVIGYNRDLRQPMREGDGMEQTRHGSPIYFVLHN